ncbi:MAG: ATP-binding cassette domain-containing protein [Victivallales bacterium]|jgi:excinuclease ABC subunit A
MGIDIVNAYAYNLKNISLSIPHNRITGLTGVSGSGKSTLLKKILAASGALNFSRLKTKTIQDHLVIDDIVDVSAIKNLPQTLFIDVVNHVTNAASTLSTISGIHEILREMFTHAAKTYCLRCGNEIQSDIFPFFRKYVEYITIDVIYDKTYDEKRTLAASLGNLLKEEFYDISCLPTTIKRERARASITVATAPLSEHRFKELGNLLECTILAKITGIDALLNPLLQTFCPTCLHIVPRLHKSRFSFNVAYDDGGGGCTRCRGIGKIQHIALDSMIADRARPILCGGFHFVNETGIKYTTITEKFISAFCNQQGININKTVGRLTQQELKLLLQGSGMAISFQDRIGGKKALAFEGVINYLITSFHKGARRSSIAPFIRETPCDHCEGTRIDPTIDAFRLHGVVLRDLLKMTLKDLRNWGHACSAQPKCKDIDSHLQKLESRLSTYEKVSCLHLCLNRSSSTLSGGELQRIRLCAMVNTNLKNICYLLDEPSSSLHYQDIEKLSVIFQEICERGNTLILVEHNKKLLSSCDYIVELGVGGGTEGGQVLFTDYIENINNYQTPTAKYLCGKVPCDMAIVSKPLQKQLTGAMSFTNVSLNNLKNVSATIFYNAFTTICGISGSGKSSFTRAIFERISQDMQKYGFHNAVYLNQRGIQTNDATDVGTLLRVMETIANLYETHTGTEKKCFLTSSEAGKCRYCMGRGFMKGKTGERLGICPQCEGRRYDAVTLSHRYRGLTIHNILNIPLAQLPQALPDAGMTNIGSICTQLGIGYLTLSRSIKSLSRGEYQRVVLARLLAQNEKRTLCFLDEPSKGLHHEDIRKMTEVIKRLAANENTIIAVEHNPTIIYESDYTIEFGPGAGIEGGEIIYSGTPCRINDNDTPTARAIYDAHSQVPFFPKKRHHAEDSVFSISSETARTELKQHAINRISTNIDDVLRACKKTEAAFLDAAIPNNNSLLDQTFESILDINVPPMLLVDFAEEKMRCDISVYNALNISTSLIKGFAAVNSQESQLLCYVFSDKSDIGKCLRCRGKGNRFSLPRKMFFEGAELSRQCVGFLANSTNYKTAKILLKETTGVDIGKRLSQMTNKEKSILFDGLDALMKTNDNIYEEWKGVIECAILNYKYYPDKNLGASFPMQKEKIACRFCEGKLLERKFADYKFCGLTFADWMTLPTRDVLRILSCSPGNNHSDAIMHTLNDLNELCVEDIRLIDAIGGFTCTTQGLMKLLSLYANNIYGTVIVIKNMAQLTPSQRKIVNDMTKKWIKSNTIVEL